MVYHLNQREPYETLTRLTVLDRDRDFYRRVEFAQPDGVDAVERINRHSMLSGYTIDPKSVAGKMRWGGDTRSIPDFEVIGNILIVSETARSIIESLEPRRHQFPVLDFYRPDGTYLQRHYWLVACNRIDSVSAEHTTYIREAIWRSHGDETRRLVFSTSAIAGRHLWQDPFLVNRYLCSDALGQALMDSKMSGLRNPLQHFDEA